MHLDTEAFNPPEGEDWVKWLKESRSYLSEDMPDETNLTFGGLPAVRIYTPGGGGGSSADYIDRTRGRSHGWGPLPHPGFRYPPG